MAKEEQIDRPQEKKLAHEVILDEMKRLCGYGDEKEKKSSTARFAELCMVMENMIIPQNKINIIISETQSLILETPIFRRIPEEAIFKIEVAKKVGMAQCLVSQLEIQAKKEG